MKRLIALLLCATIIFSGNIANAKIVNSNNSEVTMNLNSDENISDGRKYVYDHNFITIIQMLEEFLGIELDGFIAYYNKFFDEKAIEKSDTEEKSWDDGYEYFGRNVVYNPKLEFMIFFEEQLGYDYNELSKEQSKKIIKKYKKAQEAYQKEGYVSTKNFILKAQVNETLRELGYDVPIHSLVDAAQHLKDDITKEEYKKLIDLSLRSLKSLDETQILKDSVIADKIISKYGLSAKEILIQSSGYGIQLGLYNVDNGRITKNNLDTVLDTKDSAKIDNQHQKIWDKVQDIIPSKYMEMINRFEINTDGYGEITAFVDSVDNRNWSLSVDIRDLLDEDGRFMEDGIITIIHEFAHIISLNSEQMTTDKRDNTLYTVEEGTLKKDSYLNMYYQRFWKDLISEREKTYNDEDFYTFYENHSNDFVTEYAATNPVEDFAETFAVFIVEDRKSDDEVVNQKVNFFYQFPELVTLREDIREAIKEL